MALGKTISVTWQGAKVEALVPAPLRDLHVELPERVVRATERAISALRLANQHIADRRFETLARLLLRAEGVASSRIEGVRAPAEQVAMAEIDSHAADTSASWVADNLAVVEASLHHANSSAVLGARDLHTWHRRLMGHGGLPGELVGRYRRAQNWVGGPSPRQAAYVPPPAEHVVGLMRDLLRFANSAPYDPVTVAAIVHAQFETIHPYGDGNGRIGRVLIGWTLARHTEARVPPPVSIVMARDVGGYLSGLTRYRQGDISGWVAWLADAVRRSAEGVEDVVAAADDLRRRWDDLLAELRSDAAARRLLDMVSRDLVVSAPVVAHSLGVSGPTARNAIAALASRGILEPIAVAPRSAGRPAQWWAASELLALVSRWSR